MAFIPPRVQATDRIRRMQNAGLRHLNSGKTGELFELRGDYLLMVRTDRISIFDFVLPAYVIGKGYVLTAMTVMWLIHILVDVLSQFGGHHLVAYGQGIDAYLPDAVQKDPDLQMRAIVIKRLPEPDIECIVRGFLTGSSLKPYNESRIVCGHELSVGLHDGSMLEAPIFTPTTKARVGNDEHIDYRTVRQSHGMNPETMSLAIYQAARAYAEQHGIYLADTKFELSGTTLIDEVLTPDSSRFWLIQSWQEAQRRNPPGSPIGFDKQFIRDWGKRIETPFNDAKNVPIVGINNLKPVNPDHVEFVSQLAVPEQVLRMTTELYFRVFEMLFGQSLVDFWKSAGVAVEYTMLQ